MGFKFPDIKKELMLQHNCSYALPRESC